MKRNVLQNAIEFIFKYIWIFFTILIILEVISTRYSATLLMKQTAQGIMQSVSGEVSSRVDSVLRLLNGISKDPAFSDIAKPLYDRAVQALPYQNSYNLYMIALTDKEVNVISADTASPSEKLSNLAHRDYMKKLYSTGEYQITDAFVAGADNTTMNYTIAVPILKDNVVEGSVFGSIYFDDIEAILRRNLHDNQRSFYLLGQTNKVMAGDIDDEIGKSFLDLAKDVRFIGTTPEIINSNMINGQAGSWWEWNNNGLNYVLYQNIPPTNWTIIYQIRYLSVFAMLLPMLATKCLMYFLLCLAVSLLGQHFLKRQLSGVNHLLDKIALMQKELYQSEQASYDSLLELTQQGLVDQLTGLSTRSVLFSKIPTLLTEKNAKGCVMFIDLDDLKQINDIFGHQAGDTALIHFSKVLKQFEQTFGGIAARYGGDEFILILDSVIDDEAISIAKNICSKLSTTLAIKESLLPIHGSIGLSFYPEHGTKPEELISRADLALYVAKQNGKNKCVLYDSSGMPVSI